MARVATWAAQEGRAVGRIVTEIGSALSGKRRQLLALLREATVTTIVVEHRDTASRGSELVEADRCFASSRTCHGCGLVQDLGGTSIGHAKAVGRAISAMTTPRSTWRGIGPGHPTKLAWWGPRPSAPLEPP